VAPHLCSTGMDVLCQEANIRIRMLEKPRNLDATLASVYRATCYHVAAPGAQLQLRVDQYDVGLAKVLREAWVESAALLTAWNPGSQACPKERNEARQEELVRELKAAGYPCLAGSNVPDQRSADAWVEPSVLALDVPLAAAHEIAARYGQVAFLWIDKQATPRLVATAASPA
jgi:hypothetical protein